MTSEEICTFCGGSGDASYTSDEGYEHFAPCPHCRTSGLSYSSKDRALLDIIKNMDIAPTRRPLEDAVAIALKAMAEYEQSKK